MAPVVDISDRIMTRISNTDNYRNNHPFKCPRVNQDREILWICLVWIKEKMIESGYIEYKED